MGERRGGGGLRVVPSNASALRTCMLSSKVSAGGGGRGEKGAQVLAADDQVAPHIPFERTANRRRSDMGWGVHVCCRNEGGAFLKGEAAEHQHGHTRYLVQVKHRHQLIHELLVVLVNQVWWWVRHLGGGGEVRATE